MRAFFLGLTFVLSGCGGWTHPTASESDFYRDRAQCDSQAMRDYPVMMVTQGGYTTPSQTVCYPSGYNQVRCETRPGTTMYQTSKDQNLVMRNAAFDGCLRSKGYVFKLSR